MQVAPCDCVPAPIWEKKCDEGSEDKRCGRCSGWRPLRRESDVQRREWWRLLQYHLRDSGVVGSSFASCTVREYLVTHDSDDLLHWAAATPPVPGDHWFQADPDIVTFLMQCARDTACGSNVSLGSQTDTACVSNVSLGSQTHVDPSCVDITTASEAIEKDGNISVATKRVKIALAVTGTMTLRMSQDIAKAMELLFRDGRATLGLKCLALLKTYDVSRLVGALAVGTLVTANPRRAAAPDKRIADSIRALVTVMPTLSYSIRAFMWIVPTGTSLLLPQHDERTLDRVLAHESCDENGNGLRLCCSELLLIATLEALEQRFAGRHFRPNETILRLCYSHGLAAALSHPLENARILVLNSWLRLNPTDAIEARPFIFTPPSSTSLSFTSSSSSSASSLFTSSSVTSSSFISSSFVSSSTSSSFVFSSTTSLFTSSSSSVPSSASFSFPCPIAPQPIFVPNRVVSDTYTHSTSSFVTMPLSTSVTSAPLLLPPSPLPPTIVPCSIFALDETAIVTVKDATRAASFGGVDDTSTATGVVNGVEFAGDVLHTNLSVRDFENLFDQAFASDAKSRYWIQIVCHGLKFGTMLALPSSIAAARLPFDMRQKWPAPSLLQWLRDTCGFSLESLVDYAWSPLHLQQFAGLLSSDSTATVAASAQRSRLLSLADDALCACAHRSEKATARWVAALVIESATSDSAWRTLQALRGEMLCRSLEIVQWAHETLNLFSRVSNATIGVSNATLGVSNTTLEVGITAPGVQNDRVIEWPVARLARSGDAHRVVRWVWEVLDLGKSCETKLAIALLRDTAFMAARRQPDS
jgi:hypothetical protein